MIVTLGLVLVCFVWIGPVAGRLPPKRPTAASLQASVANAGNANHGGGNNRHINLAGAAYTVPLLDFILDPTLAIQGFNYIQGGFDAQAIGDKYFVSGSENFYSPFAAPTWSTVNVVDRQGNIVSQLLCPPRMSTTNPSSTTAAPVSSHDDSMPKTSKVLLPG